VAPAIATNPHVILYDEPTAGLDPANVNRVDELIQHLQREYSVTSILVTHNMESVYRVSNRVGLLHHKTLSFVGSLNEFKRTSDDTVRRFVKGEINEEEERLF